MLHSRVLFSGGPLLSPLRLVTLCLAVLAARLALADDDAVRAKAREHLEKAKVHYRLREFDAAVQAFREAYRLRPVPALLFNLAQAERMGGNAREAKFHYEEYLRELATAPNRDEVEGFIRELDAQLAREAREAALSRIAALAPPVVEAPVPAPAPVVTPVVVAPPVEPAPVPSTTVSAPYVEPRDPPPDAPPAEPVVVAIAKPMPEAPRDPAPVVAPVVTPPVEPPPVVTPPVVTPPVVVKPLPVPPLVVRAPEPEAVTEAVLIDVGMDDFAPPVVRSSGGSKVGWVMLGVAVVAAGTGAFFGLQANTARAEADKASFQSDAVQRLDAARTQAFTANVLYGGAGLVGLIGVIEVLAW